MAMQTWVNCLGHQDRAGTSFASFTTAKTVLWPTALREIKGNTLYPGRVARVTVVGGLGNLVTTPGTVEFQIKIGSVVAFTTGAIQLNATAHTNLPFWLEIMLTCYTIGDGTVATFMGQGKAQGKMFTVTAAQVDGVNSNTVILAPATAPAVGTGFDSTTDKVVDFWAGFSISDAANTIQIHQFAFEFLN